MVKFRSILLYLLTLAVSAQLLIPSGFMPGAVNGGPSIVMCSGKVVAATKSDSLNQKFNKNYQGVCSFAAQMGSPALTPATPIYAVQTFTTPLHNKSDGHWQVAYYSFQARGPPNSFD